jgi:tripartite-type tricarboxylate transporter receptor subunit TctC
MLPHVKAGRLNMLAVTGASRSAIIPDVPTFREYGMTFMDVMDNWYALLAPAKTPAEIVKSLHYDLSEVLAMPDVREQMRTQGLSVQISSPEELGSLVQADFARWRKTIADAKIPVE